MKINIKYHPSTMAVRVWFGEIKNGYVYRNGEPDLSYSKEHYNYHFQLRQLAKEGRI